MFNKRRFNEANKRPDAFKIDRTQVYVMLFKGGEMENTAGITANESGFLQSDPKRRVRFGCKAPGGKNETKNLNRNLISSFLPIFSDPFVGQKRRLIVNAKLIFQSLNSLQLFP